MEGNLIPLPQYAIVRCSTGSYCPGGASQFTQYSLVQPYTKGLWGGGKWYDSTGKEVIAPKPPEQPKLKVVGATTAMGTELAKYANQYVTVMGKTKITTEGTVLEAATIKPEQPMIIRS